MRADRLKSLRTRYDYSQDDMASKLSISTRQYRRYEAGEIPPPADQLSKMAQEFGVSADWLLGLTDESGGDGKPSREANIRRLLQVFSELNSEQAESLITFALFLKSQRVGSGTK